MGFDGDGYCNSTLGESSSFCPADCGGSNQTSEDNETTTTITLTANQITTTPATPYLEQPIPGQPTIPITNQTIPEQIITEEQIIAINEINVLGNETSCLQGCFYDGKCLPIGIRRKISKVNVYCNTTSMWEYKKGKIGHAIIIMNAGVIFVQEIKKEKRK